MSDLKALPQTKDWYLLRIDPNVYPINIDNFFMAAHAVRDCLTFLLDVCISYFVEIDKVIRYPNGHWEFYIGNAKFAAIESIAFEQIDQLNIKRVENALKDAPYRDYSKIVGSLKKGVDGYQESVIDREKSSNKFEPLLITGNNICSALMLVAEELFIEKIARHQAQELVAALLNTESWQHLKALENRSAHLLRVPYCIITNDSDAKVFEDNSTFFLGLPSALHRFGKLLKHSKHSDLQLSYSDGLIIWNKRPDIESTLEGDLNRDYTGLTLFNLKIINLVDARSVDAELLELSNDPTTVLAEILCQNNDIEQRILSLHKKDGIPEENHVFYKGWVYWIDNRHSALGTFNAEKLERFGKYNFQLAIASSLKKALIFEIKGEFWLATDWDREPKHRLPDLDKDGAQILNNKFKVRYEKELLWERAFG